MALQWSLILFTVLAGMGGWMFACVASSEFTGKGTEVRFRTSLISMAVIIVGGLCSVTHLSHPTRMLGALQHPTSGIAVEAFMLGFVCLFILIYVILLKRGSSDSVRKAIGVVGGLVGIVFSYAMGSSYMMAAREAWNTVLLPLDYAASSMVLGIAGYMLVLAVSKQREAASYYGLPLAVAGVLALVAGFAYGIYSESLTEQPVLFWLGMVVIGGAVPLVCGIVANKKDGWALAGASCATVAGVVGSISVRALMWAIGVGLYTFFNALS